MGNHKQFIRERVWRNEPHGRLMTFTFTMDAFPDYTRFDKTKKVLAAIQIIETAGASDIERLKTDHIKKHEEYFID